MCFLYSRLSSFRRRASNTRKPIVRMTRSGMNAAKSAIELSLLPSPEPLLTGWLCIRKKVAEVKLDLDESEANLLSETDAAHATRRRLRTER